MKKIIFALIVLSLPAYSYTQSLTPMVISSIGGFSSDANSSLSYTVGDMTMVETFSASGNILTQGFEQPNDVISGILSITNGANGSFVVYPNPAVNDLWFGFQFPAAGHVSVIAYNALGQKLGDVYEDEYTSGKITSDYDISYLASGSYFLSVTMTGNDGQTHFITKPFQIIH